MSKTPSYSILLAAAIAVLPSLPLSAVEMFENLSYGESRQATLKKLNKSKRFEKPKKSLFGSIAQDGTYKLKKVFGGLAFVAKPLWDDDDLLTQVDLYSEPSSRDSLSSAYSDLHTLLTGLYGKAKFSNGLPLESQVPDNGMTMAGAVWFHETDAISLSLGKNDGNYNIVISFMDNQPELVRTP